MANMNKDTVNNKWTLSYDIPGSGTKTITMPTKDKYVDENIEITLSTAAGELGAGSGSIQGSSTATGLLGAAQSSAPATGAYVKVEGAASVAVETAGWLDTTDETNVNLADVYYPVNEATFTIDGNAFKSVAAGYVAGGQTLETMGNGAQTVEGGELSTTASSTALASNGLSDGTTIDTSKKITLSTSDADGYYELETSGSATVARAAVTSQVTTAGYFAVDASPVTEIAAGTESVSNTHAKYYVAQSTLSADTVQSSSVDQTVTVGAGYYHEARTITVEAMDAATVAPNVANTGMSTYFNAGTSSENDVALTPRYSVTSAGYVAVQSNTAGDPEYYTIKTTSVTEGTTTVSGSTATRGVASWGTGWIESNAISAAQFKNNATAGKTYVDISDTSDAPVLVSGDYLYIDAGYTDDLKISLAKLVPDGSDVAGHAEYILAGHSAYDNAGVLVAGSIPTYDGSYTIS